MSEELRELNDALGDALAVVAKQQRHLLEDLQDFHEYLSNQYMAAEKEYDSSRGTLNHREIFHAVARIEAYADARERLQAIMESDPNHKAPF